MPLFLRAARSSWAPALVLTVGCVALAGLSLLLPYSLSKDEWSWLIWGRDLRQLDLQLAGGTVWKPLPVLFTIFVSAFGDAAPHLWLVVARAAWLLALVAGYRVGTRLGGRWAGLLSVFALLLIPAGAEWLAYFGRGSSEPIIVALVLWAIDRHLQGRRLQALALASLATLGRPEPWPLVIVYAGLVWRGEGGRGRAVVLALLAMVPALWVGGSWWGAGDPVLRPLGPVIESGGGPVASPGGHAPAGTTSAQDTPARMARIAAAMVIVPVWMAAGFGFLRALAVGRSDDGEHACVVIALGVAALAWALVVIAGGVIGLPLASRFLFGPAALLSILGAVGIVQAARAVSSSSGRAALVSAIAVATLPFAVARAAELRSWAPQAGFAPFANPPWVEVLERGHAADRLRACGDRIRVRDMPSAADTRTGAGKFARAEIAWRIGARLTWIDRLSRRRVPDVDQALVLAPWGAPGVPPPGLSTSSASEATRPGRWRGVAVANGWALYEVGCRPAGGPAG